MKVFLPVIVVTWLGVIFSFVGYYVLWRTTNADRMQELEELISKPFDSYEDYISYYTAEKTQYHFEKKSVPS